MLIAALFPAVGAVPLAIASSAAAPPRAPLPPGITIGKADGIQLFVDSRGMSLYIYEDDRGRGRSSCYFECADKWPPLLAAPTSVPIGDWTLVQRADGTTQWAYQASPLYRYSADRRPGQATGAGYMHYWQPAEYVPAAPTILAPGNIKIVWKNHRYIYADSRGLPVYTLEANLCKSHCGGWTPLLAGLASQDVGDWTVIDHADHRQWCYRGKATYLFEPDADGRTRNGQQAGGKEIAL